jgi:hypothetical protein
MKYILTLLLLINVAYGQFAPTSSKTKFSQGIGIGSKDTSAFSPLDTMVVTMGRDSIMYYKYKSYWRSIGGSTAAYKLIADTLFNNGYTTRARMKQGLDSLAATKVSSVGLTMPSAFSVAGSPVTTSGTLAVTATGTATQYIRGDGVLATFPSTGAGGSSVYYYLNGSVAASVATYKQMANTAVIGGGTDFNLTGNGLIAQFLTDVANPNRLEIPGGAWNFEMFFSMSSSGGTPQFYVELLKYNGSTFTSIASGVAVPETISGGTPTDLYLTSLAVPTTALLLTDRLAVRVYIVNNSGGRTATLHTENGNLCQITTTFAGGIAALNGLTANNQYFALDSAATGYSIVSASETHTFKFPNMVRVKDTAAMLTPYLIKADSLSGGYTTWLLTKKKVDSLGSVKVGGTGTTGYIPKFTASGTIGNSVMNEAGGVIYTTGYLSVSPASPISPLAIIQVGNRNVLNSSAAQILVGGFYNNAVATNGHAFADNSELSKNGSWAYASYDGRVDITGTSVGADHYVSFQAAPNYAFTGTMLDNFGTYTTHSISSGTITNNYGHYIANPVKSGTGAITNNYGIYIANQTSGSSNYSIYSAGGFNYLTGSLQVGGTITADNTGGNMRFKGGGTGTTDGGVYINASGNLYLADWDGTRGFVTLGNGNGYYYGGNFGVKTATPSQALDVAGNGQFSGRVNVNGATDDAAIALKVTGTAAFSSSIAATSAAFSAAVNNIGLNVSGSTTGTAQTYAQWRNTGGDLYLGRESSTGGAYFTGSSSYADVWYGTNPMQVIIGSVKRFEIATTGIATLTNLAGTGDRLVQASSTGVLSATTEAPTSGTYTPTLSNTTNITSSTLSQATYIRVGDIVTVSVGVGLTPTLSATNTILTVTLPITTATSTQNYVGNGTVFGNAVSNLSVSGIVNVASTTTATFTFYSTALTSSLANIQFQYKIN